MSEDVTRRMVEAFCASVQREDEHVADVVRTLAGFDYGLAVLAAAFRAAEAASWRIIDPENPPPRDVDLMLWHGDMGEMTRPETMQLDWYGSTRGGWVKGDPFTHWREPLPPPAPEGDADA